MTRVVAVAELFFEFGSFRSLVTEAVLEIVPAFCGARTRIVIVTGVGL